MIYLKFVSKKLAVSLLLLSMTAALVAACDTGGSTGATATPVRNANPAAPAPVGTTQTDLGTTQVPVGVPTSAAGVPTPDMSATEVTTATLVPQQN